MRILALAVAVLIGTSAANAAVRTKVVEYTLTLHTSGRQLFDAIEDYRLPALRFACGIVSPMVDS